MWTAWSGNELLGCGALKELDATHGEIKSMRTASRTMEARRRRYERLSLETGSMKAFEPAQRLYQSFGFWYCGPFGDYAEDPNSVFMSISLDPR